MKVKSQESLDNASSVLDITVLLVDDDLTCLSIISALLKSWKYQVSTVRNPMDVMSTLRVHSKIDLVITDLHMPGMGGIELQKKIHEEFNLPVVVMSSDENESMIHKTLASGAAYYMLKPVNPIELKNMWQYAIGSKKNAPNQIPTLSSPPSRKSSNIQEINQKIINIDVEDIESSSAEIDEAVKSATPKDCKRKTSPNTENKETRDENKEEEKSRTRTNKKVKVVWTNSLHNRFLEAIRYLGLDTVPKKILTFMNVPDLKRENVASHLQKYRIFLKKMEDAGSIPSNGLSTRTLRSTFATGHTSYILKNQLQNDLYTRFRHLNHHPFLTTTPFPVHHGVSPQNSIFSRYELPSFVLLPHLYGRRHGVQQQSTLGNSTALYNQPSSQNRSATGTVSGNAGTMDAASRSSMNYGHNGNFNMRPAGQASLCPRGEGSRNVSGGFGVMNENNNGGIMVTSTATPPSFGYSTASLVGCGSGIDSGKVEVQLSGNILDPIVIGTPNQDDKGGGGGDYGGSGGGGGGGGRIVSNSGSGDEDEFDFSEFKLEDLLLDPNYSDDFSIFQGELGEGSSEIDNRRQNMIGQNQNQNPQVILSSGDQNIAPNWNQQALNQMWCDDTLMESVFNYHQQK